MLVGKGGKGMAFQKADIFGQKVQFIKFIELLGDEDVIHSGGILMPFVGIAYQKEEGKR